MSKENTEKVIDIAAPKGNFFKQLDKFRLDQNYAEMLGIEKRPTRIPVRRPKKQEWFMVHPNPAFHYPLPLIHDELDNEFYLFNPELVVVGIDELVRKQLYYTINRQNVVFLWPVKMPDIDGRLDSWNDSAHSAAKMAMEKWIRIVSNRSLGGYEVVYTRSKLEKPEWPDMDLDEIYELAFGKRLIESDDHPILKALRGEE